MKTIQKYLYAMALAVGASFLHDGIDWQVILFIVIVIASVKWRDGLPVGERES